MSLLRPLAFVVPLSIAGCSGAAREAERHVEPPCPAVAASAPSTGEAAAPSASAAPSAPVPTRSVPSPREAVTLRAGGRALEISFTSVPLSRERVASIRLDDAAVYPPSCAGSVRELCSRAHQSLRGEGKPESDAFGKGRDLTLLDFDEREGRAYALFASTTLGSPECGTYALWVLRLDERGVRVTPPLAGCFLSARGRDAPEGPEPVVAWTEPPVLFARSPLYQPGDVVQVHTLDEATLTFTLRVKARAPANP